MSDWLNRIRIVLVRPKIAGNIGATARAMANTGLSDLVLVSPHVEVHDQRARRRAAGAEWLLKAARIVDNLADALDGVHWTVGTSCRGGMYRQAIETDPRAMADLAISRAADGQRIAVLFGTENNGLDRSEVLNCDAVVRIPSHEGYTSLNLAHAVMICVYELYVTATQRQAGAEPATKSPDAVDRADGQMMARLMDGLRDGLIELEYLEPEHPEHLLSALRAILSRAELDVGEAQILMGLAVQIQEFARYGPQRR